MCLFCIEVAKVNMTPMEVARAYLETEFKDDHIGDALVAIYENYDGDEVAKLLSSLYA